MEFPQYEPTWIFCKECKQMVYSWGLCKYCKTVICKCFDNKTSHYQKCYDCAETVCDDCSSTGILDRTRICIHCEGRNIKGAES